MFCASVEWKIPVFGAAPFCAIDSSLSPGKINLFGCSCRFSETGRSYWFRVVVVESFVQPRFVHVCVCCLRIPKSKPTSLRGDAGARWDGMVKFVWISSLDADRNERIRRVWYFCTGNVRVLGGADRDNSAHSVQLGLLRLLKIWYVVINWGLLWKDMQRYATGIFKPFYRSYIFHHDLILLGICVLVSVPL